MVSDELVFHAVQRTGSLSGASRELGVVRSTVFRRIERLESRLGTPLFQRIGKRLVLTEAGRHYADGLVPILKATRRLEQHVREMSGTPNGILRIHIPRVALGDLVIQALAEFRQVEPEVVQQVRTGPVTGNDDFDVAVQVGLTDNPSLQARILFRSQIVIVASPAYLDASGRPTQVEELCGHTGVHMLSDHGEVSSFFGGEFSAASPRPSAVVDSQQLALALALRDGGLCCLAEPFARPHLESGRLEQVLRGVDIQLPVCAVYPVPASLTTRRFVAHLQAWVAQHVV